MESRRLQCEKVIILPLIQLNHFSSAFVMYPLIFHVHFRKWKCGKFSAIAISDDGLSFVSAKKEIQWWDISGDNETLRKSFTGHSTDVFSLNFVRICGEPCVLSAAIGNRLLHAW